MQNMFVCFNANLASKKSNSTQIFSYRVSGFFPFQLHHWNLNHQPPTFKKFICWVYNFQKSISSWYDLIFTQTLDSTNYTQLEYKITLCNYTFVISIDFSLPRYVICMHSVHIYREYSRTQHRASPFTYYTLTYTQMQQSLSQIE